MVSTHRTGDWIIQSTGIQDDAISPSARSDIDTHNSASGRNIVEMSFEMQHVVKCTGSEVGVPHKELAKRILGTPKSPPLQRAIATLEQTSNCSTLYAPISSGVKMS